ncbi:MAG: hypothetical protein LBT20_04890 [Clostridiales bacterium]|jgi:hypothetical protein|nr:hypothetical protein [Clostridiales bacterium]
MMNEIEIFAHDGSDEYEYDFGIEKGYWDNIYVRKNDKIFRVNIITLIRLTQDCEYAYDSPLSGGCYVNEPNLVVVKDATKAQIIKTLLKQNEMGFFEQLAPCGNKSEAVYSRMERHWLEEDKETFNLNELDKIYP